MGIESLPEPRKGHYINKNGEMYTVSDLNDLESAFLAKEIHKEDLCGYKNKQDAKFFNIFDTEKNSSLSASELRSVFEAIDTDKNGAMSDDELNRYADNAIADKRIKSDEKYAFISFIKSLAIRNIRKTKDNLDSADTVKVKMLPNDSNIEYSGPIKLNFNNKDFDYNGNLVKGTQTIEGTITIHGSDGREKHIKLSIDARILSETGKKTGNTDKQNFTFLQEKELQKMFDKLSDEVKNKLFKEIDEIKIEYADIVYEQIGDSIKQTNSRDELGDYKQKTNVITLQCSDIYNSSLNGTNASVLTHELGHAIDEDPFTEGGWQTNKLQDLFKKFSDFVSEKYGFSGSYDKKYSYALTDVKELLAEYYSYTRNENSSVHDKLFNEIINSEDPIVKEMFTALENIINQDHANSGISFDTKFKREYGKQVASIIKTDPKNYKNLSETEKEKLTSVYNAFDKIGRNPVYGEIYSDEDFIDHYYLYLKGDTDNIPQNILDTINKLENLSPDSPGISESDIPPMPDYDLELEKFHKENPRPIPLTNPVPKDCRENPKLTEWCNKSPSNKKAYHEYQEDLKARKKGTGKYAVYNEKRTEFDTSFVELQNKISQERDLIYEIRNSNVYADWNTVKEYIKKAIQNKQFGIG